MALAAVLHFVRIENRRNQILEKRTWNLWSVHVSLKVSAHSDRFFCLRQNVDVGYGLRTIHFERSGV